MKHLQTLAVRIEVAAEQVDPADEINNTLEALQRLGM